MSTNPYAAHAAQDFGHELPSEPPRTSVLAIVALVLSLICFIPGLSTIGSVLGVFAIILIAKSAGRVKGTGIAVAAILVGLLFSMLQLGLALGVNAAMREYARFGQPVAHIEAGESTQLRGLLTKDTAAALTDADIEAFRQAYTQDAGAFQDVPSGILPVFEAFTQIGDPNQTMNQQNVPYQNPIPVPGRFANGYRLLWVAVAQNERASSVPLPAVINMAFVESDGSLVWLIDPDRLRPGASGGAGESASEATPTEEDMTGDESAPGSDEAPDPAGEADEGGSGAG